MRVRATQLGYYGMERRRPGTVFTIKSEKDFSDKWMERVDAKTSAEDVPESDDEQGEEQEPQPEGEPSTLAAVQRRGVKKSSELLRRQPKGQQPEGAV